MTKITIDGVEYDFDSFSEEAKNQYSSLKFVDGELIRLQAKVAVFQTARAMYSQGLRAALPAPAAPAEETIKF